MVAMQFGVSSSQIYCHSLHFKSVG
jgi:hypothetical protein